MPELLAVDMQDIENALMRLIPKCVDDMVDPEGHVVGYDIFEPDRFHLDKFVAEVIRVVDARRANVVVRCNNAIDNRPRPGV